MLLIRYDHVALASLWPLHELDERALLTSIASHTMTLMLIPIKNEKQLASKVTKPKREKKNGDGDDEEKRVSYCCHQSAHSSLVHLDCVN